MSLSVQTLSCVVLVESGIDALSYAALHPAAGTVYASTSGALNPRQPALLRRLFAGLAADGEVVAATDHDPAGEAMADHARQVFDALESGGRRRFRRHRPNAPGSDWNDELQAASG